MSSVKNFFTNKIIWITGASSGIGEALTDELVKKNAILLLSARNKEQLQRVREKYSYDNIFIYPMDVTDNESVENAVAEVLSIHGKVDILINNAGVSQRSLAADTKLEVDYRLMEVNYFGTIRLTKLILPSMIQHKSGQVVTVSSVMGKFGTPYRSGYAASKHALHGYFDSVRAELHTTGVSFTLVCPGFVRTAITLNALTGDGSPLNSMDPGTSNGLQPEYFAGKMLKAITSRKKEVYIGGFKERFGVYMNRFLPDLFFPILTRMSVR